MRLVKKLLLFLTLLVIALFASLRLGDSFSYTGSPSSIVRLEFSKTLKKINKNYIDSSSKKQRDELHLVINDRRQFFAGGGDNDDFFYKNKANNFTQFCFLCDKEKINNKPISLSTTITKVLRI